MEKAAEPRGPVRLLAFLAATIALVAASIPVAKLVLFATFRPWDDEGYMLLAVRQYARGFPLYDRIETPYGPLSFEILAGASRLLGLSIDNDSARWIALLVWTGASLGCLALVFRASGSALLALAAYVLCFPLLVALNGEPLHPSHAIVLLLPFLALAASKERFAIAGAIVGAVVCMKLNVGAFLLLAFAGAFARRRVALLAIALFPILLMRSRLGVPWARDLAILEVVSLAGFAVSPPELRWSAKQALAFARGAIAVVAVAFGVAVATGTTLAAIGRVLVLDTLRFPALQWAEPALPPRWVVPLAVALLPVAVALRRKRATTALAGLRVLAAIATLILALRPGGAFAALPFAWLIAPPWILGYLVVAVSLQAYPVAGSQVNFFAFLLPAIALVALHDTARALAGPVRAGAVAVAAAALALASPFYRAIPGWSDAARRFVPLALPGAESIRLPELEVATRQWLAANLRRNGSTFVGEPGLHSLYIWTGEEPPVPFYPHAWTATLPPDRQGPLADAVATREDLCVVRNRELVEMWRHGRTVTESPVDRAIERDYRAAGRTGGYELLLRKDREPDLVLCARRAEDPSGALALRLSFPPMPGVRIARVAICDGTRDRVLYDTASGLRIAEPERLPAELDARRDLILLCPVELAQHDVDDLLVRAYDDRGAVAARLRFVR